MVAMCFFETLVPVYQTTRYQNLQDHNPIIWMSTKKGDGRYKIQEAEGNNLMMQKAYAIFNQL